MPMEEQVVVFWAATNGYLDNIPVEKVRDFEVRLLQDMKARYKKVISEIAEKKVLDEKLTKELEKIVKDFLKSFK
jgi:F-type H+-transporting ATPase subunit alpha